MSPPLELRKATLADIEGICGLINDYAAGGIMLPRTPLEVAERIRDFTVAVSSRGLEGCGALQIYNPESAEIRSLAVRPDLKGHGVGRRIVLALIHEAKEFELDDLFAFTYVPEFFAKAGFQEVDRGELPMKAWKDCLRCPKFQACDEIAVYRRLRPAPVGGYPRTWGERTKEQPTPLVQVQVPIVKPASH
jgi:amino-acid N-acetyltransferase